jgi:putative methanogenesis marker protein 8
MSDRHVMSCMGMTKVVIENGRVTEVGEPEIRYCPLFKKYRGIDDITAESVRENIEFRMGSFGMCTESREVRMKDFLAFGVSETLSSALRHDMLDCAVIAADGCGTVVVTDPEIVQGLGGRISGICETSPIRCVINTVGRDNILDPENTSIDMIKGVDKAICLGHSRIAVTIAFADDARRIRETYGEAVTIVAVHTSKTSEEDAKIMFDNCDIITACASVNIREEAKRRDVLVAGKKIPIFGVTPKGQELIMIRLNEIGKQPNSTDEFEDLPHPLI